MLELDHVVIAAADLGAAATALEERFGLASLEGGRHPGWGTANRIVPLGDSYLELVAVIDEAEAADSAFGRWVGAASGELQPLGWAVRTDDLDAVARRLDLDVIAGARTRPDGQVIRWQLAGTAEAAAEPALPFFIEWAPGTVLPGRTRESDNRLSELRLSGDPQRLVEWLGRQRLPVHVEPGAPAVVAVVLAGPAGEQVLSG